MIWPMEFVTCLFSKEYPMRKKQEPRAVAEPAPIPQTAGEPTLTIRKEWVIGDYMVVADGDMVQLGRYFQCGEKRHFEAYLHTSIPASLCKAFANALLQV